MVDNIVKSLSIDNDTGRVSFSGLGSGIDFEAIIEATIAAKRVSAVQIERKITSNDVKISEMSDLKTLASNFSSILNSLRGSNLIEENNIFNSKLAFTDTQATSSAPSGHNPSAAGSLLCADVTSDAVNGVHTIEVVQIAKAQSIRTDAFTSKTAELVNDLGFTAGDMEINGKVISIADGDTLLDLRDKINNVNTGSSATGISASIVTVSSTEHYLVLTNEETGTANAMVFSGTQAIHNQFGFTTGGTDTVKNEIVGAQDAIIRVDNLGVDITRSSNTIDDVIEGVTLNLFKAEEDTEVVLEISQDLNSTKTKIVEFIDAYNALRDFIDDQRTEKVRVEGGEPEFGTLAFDSNLRRVIDEMTTLASSVVSGATDGYSSLSQVGITVNGNYQLELDEDVFDNALITSPEDMERLFTFDFSTSDSRVSYYKVGANTGGSGQDFYLNIGGTDANGNILSANLSSSTGNGTGNDTSVSINGNVITVSDGETAEGLVLIVTGNNLGALTDININFTRGVASTMFSFFDEISKTGGYLDEAISGIETQNENYQDRVDQIDDRLELTRQTLIAKYVAMESSLARLNSIKDSLTQQLASLNGEDN